MYLLVAAPLLILFALFTAAWLRVKGRAAYLLALYLLASAAVVLCFEITGLLRALNNRFAFLGLQVLLTLAAGLFWQRSGKPSLLGPFAPDLKRLDFHMVEKIIRRHPALSLLALGVDLAYAVNAYVILVVPPNNNDSLYLHMARVARWLQTGTYFPYPTEFPLQLFYPFNAQSLIYWTVLFGGSDQFAGFIQFSAALVTCLGIYSLARLLNLKPSQGVMAALMFATFPQVFLQATTTQNDLVPAAFFISSVIFLIRGLRSPRQFAELFLSSLGLSLALGTKQTVFFLLPGFACLCLLLIWQNPRCGLVFFSRWIPAAVLSFALVGAAIYIQNTVVFHNPMGDPQSIQGLFNNPIDNSAIALDSSPTTGNTALLPALWININRLGYQFIDTTGLPPLIEGYLFRGKALAARLFYNRIGLPLESMVASSQKSLVHFDFYHRPPVQEDETWYGIFAPVLMVPASLINLTRSRRSKNPLPAGLWAIAISFSILELVFRPGWDAYQGRNFVLAIIVLSPFLGSLYQPNLLSRIGLWLITALAIYMLATLALNNSGKPLIGQHAIWILSRSEKVTLQNFHLKEPAQLVEKFVPAEAVLGLPGGTWEYPFYDQGLHRRLVAVTPAQRYCDAAWLHEQGITYLLAKTEDLPPCAMPPLIQVAAGQSWALYSVP
jgi:hypothetical protein